MVEISLCERKNFCIDCDNNECWHAGQIEADCPKWRCDYSGECEDCDFLKEYYKAGGRREQYTEAM